MANVSLKRQQQDEYWKSVIKKYEDGISKMQVNLYCGAGNRPTSDECGGCGCITGDDDSLSGFSITSTDLERMMRVKALVERERELKGKLDEMEIREQTYVETLKRADELMAEKEQTFRECMCNTQESGAKVKEDYAKMNEELIKDNQRLAEELLDLKLEMKQCMERIEGPIARQMQKEMLKNKALEREIQLAKEAALNSQNAASGKTQALKKKLQEATQNITKLNAVNQKLKEELCELDEKYADLQEDLVQQKLEEAAVIKRLSDEAKRTPCCSCCACIDEEPDVPKTDEDCDCCICPGGDNGDDGDDDKGAGGGSRRPSDRRSCGDKGGDSKRRSVDRSGTRRPSDDKSKKPPCSDVSNRNGGRGAGDNSLNALARKLSETLTKVDHCKTCRTSVTNDILTTAEGLKEVLDLLDKEQDSDSCSCKKASSEKLVCTCEGDAGSILSDNEMTEKSVECTCCADKGAQCLSFGQSPADTQVVKETKSCTCQVVSVLETREAVCVCPSEASEPEEPPAEEECLCTSQETIQQKVEEIICSPTCPLAIEAAKSVEKDLCISDENAEEVAITSQVQIIGDLEVEIDTQVVVTDDEETPEDLHVTMAMTTSGTLEVITEGPAGIIETTLTYTGSGNIEVLTEVTEFQEGAILGEDGDLINNMHGAIGALPETECGIEIVLPQEEEPEEQQLSRQPSDGEGSEVAYAEWCECDKSSVEIGLGEGEEPVEEEDICECDKSFLEIDLGETEDLVTDEKPVEEEKVEERLIVELENEEDELLELEVDAKEAKEEPEETEEEPAEDDLMELEVDSEEVIEESEEKEEEPKEVEQPPQGETTLETVPEESEEEGPDSYPELFSDEPVEPEDIEAYDRLIKKTMEEEPPDFLRSKSIEEIAVQCVCPDEYKEQMDSMLDKTQKYIMEALDKASKNLRYRIAEVKCDVEPRKCIDCSAETEKDVVQESATTIEKEIPEITEAAPAESIISKQTPTSVADLVVPRKESSIQSDSIKEPSSPRASEEIVRRYSKPEATETESAILHEPRKESSTLTAKSETPEITEIAPAESIISKETPASVPDLVPSRKKSGIQSESAKEPCSPSISEEIPRRYSKPKATETESAILKEPFKETAISEVDGGDGRTLEPVRSNRSKRSAPYETGTQCGCPLQPCCTCPAHGIPRDSKTEATATESAILKEPFKETAISTIDEDFGRTLEPVRSNRSKRSAPHETGTQCGCPLQPCCTCPVDGIPKRYSKPEATATESAIFEEPFKETAISTIDGDDGRTLESVRSNRSKRSVPSEPFNESATSTIESTHDGDRVSLPQSTGSPVPTERLKESATSTIESTSEGDKVSLPQSTGSPIPPEPLKESATSTIESAASEGDRISLPPSTGSKRSPTSETASVTNPELSEKSTQDPGSVEHVLSSIREEEPIKEIGTQCVCPESIEKPCTSGEIQQKDSEPESVEEPPTKQIDDEGQIENIEPCVCPDEFKALLHATLDEANRNVLEALDKASQDVKDRIANVTCEIEPTKCVNCSTQSEQVAEEPRASTNASTGSAAPSSEELIVVPVAKFGDGEGDTTASSLGAESQGVQEAPEIIESGTSVVEPDRTEVAVEIAPISSEKSIQDLDAAKERKSKCKCDELKIDKCVECSKSRLRKSGLSLTESESSAKSGSVTSGRESPRKSSDIESIKGVSVASGEETIDDQAPEKSTVGSGSSVIEVKSEQETSEPKATESDLPCTCPETFKAQFVATIDEAHKCFQDALTKVTEQVKDQIAEVKCDVDPNKCISCTAGTPDKATPEPPSTELQEEPITPKEEDSAGTPDAAISKEPSIQEPSSTELQDEPISPEEAIPEASEVEIPKETSIHESSASELPIKGDGMVCVNCICPINPPEVGVCVEESVQLEPVDTSEASAEVIPEETPKNDRASQDVVSNAEVGIEIDVPVTSEEATQEGEPAASGSKEGGSEESVEGVEEPTAETETETEPLFAPRAVEACICIPECACPVCHAKDLSNCICTCTCIGPCNNDCKPQLISDVKEGVDTLTDSNGEKSDICPIICGSSVCPLNSSVPEASSGHPETCSFEECICFDQSETSDEHPPECKCIKCVCENCSDDNVQLLTEHSPSCYCRIRLLASKEKPGEVCDENLAKMSESERRSTVSSAGRASGASASPGSQRASGQSSLPGSQRPSVQPSVAHVDGCLCTVCIKELCPKLLAPPAEEPADTGPHPPGCNCATCVCTPCMPPLHPPGCQCPECLCDPCDMKHVAGCDCSICICEPCKPSGDHPSGCQCTQCTCDPCQQEGHPSGCMCLECSCEPCAKKPQPEPEQHAEDCECPMCICAPCPKMKPDDHPAMCFCPLCACDPCKKRPDLQAKQDEHPEGCKCDECSCDPCANNPSKGVQHPVGCRCEECLCSPCTDPDKVKKHPEGCQCPQCVCSPCSDPTKAKDAESAHPKGCFCDKCICERCIDPNKSAAADVCGTDEQAGQDGRVPGHPKNCFCDKCICANCVDPSKQGSGHPDGCKCDECVCKPCPRQHPPDCSCAKCVCKPCPLKDKAATPGHPPNCCCSECRSKLDQLGMDHPVDCRCIDCLCKQCAGGGKPKQKHPDDCTCAECMSSKGKDHPANCKCETCVCKRKRSKGRDRSKDHGDGCMCPKCLEKAARKSQKPHDLACICPECIMNVKKGKDGERKSRHHRGCECDNCVCNPCVRKERSAWRHGEGCICEICERRRRNNETHPKNCKCNVCICQRVEGRRKELPPCSPDGKSTTTKGDKGASDEDHTNGCRCSQCIGKMGHPPGCKCDACLCTPCAFLTLATKHSDTCRCSDCMVKSQAPRKDGPPGSIHGSDCNCEKCMKELCKRIAASIKASPAEDKMKKEMQARLKAIEDENKKRRKDMDDLKKLINQVKEQCLVNDAKIAKGNGNVACLKKQKCSIETTLSGLQSALKNLQTKCREKDKMLETMAEELKTRAGSQVMNEVYEKLTTEERSEQLCSLLPTPDEPPKPCPHPNYPDCPCADDPTSDAPVEAQEVRPSDDCVCGGPSTAVDSSDPSPLEITQIRRVSADSLLVTWVKPADPNIIGYEILVDGVLKSRVRSAGRTTAVIHSLEFKCSLAIDLYAVTQKGRCEPPARAIFN